MSPRKSKPPSSNAAPSTSAKTTKAEASNIRKSRPITRIARAIYVPKSFLESVSHVWPHIRRVVITPEAMQYLQSGFGLVQEDLEKLAWNQERWCAWVLDRFKIWKEAGIDCAFED